MSKEFTEFRNFKACFYKKKSHRLKMDFNKGPI